MKTKVNLTVDLSLTKKEADWLRGVMQNPLSPVESLEEEDSLDREMRHKFFKALSPSLTVSKGAEEDLEKSCDHDWQAVPNRLANVCVKCGMEWRHD